MSKTVIAWGRMNPPTIGHQKLVDKVEAEAKNRGAMPHIYLSHTQDKKKNPLSYNDKISIAQKAFGKSVTKSSAKTLIQILKELEKMGHTEVVLVAGSDRVPEFKTLLDKYNGKEYNFDNIDVISAGERDPDADDVSGMSASKMRAAASAGEKDKFFSGLPTNLSVKDKEQAYNKVRSAMGINEEVELIEAADPWKKNADKVINGKYLYADQVFNRAQFKTLNKIREYGTFVDTGLGRVLVRKADPDDFAKFTTKEYVMANAKDQKYIMNVVMNERGKLFSWELRKKEGNILSLIKAWSVDGMLEQVESIDNLFEEYLEERKALNIMQRKALGRRMKRLAPKLKRKREIAKKRMATPEKLRMRSRKAAINFLRKKYAGKLGQNYASLSPSQKETVDKIIQKKLGSVETISKRLMPKIRKSEIERVKRARSGTNESIDINDIFEACWKGYQQIGMKKKNGKEVPNCVPEAQDSDIKDRPGSQPKGYHAGLKKSTKIKRDSQFQKQAKMSDDNPAAYKPAPGDADAKTKTSKHTKKYRQMYGENADQAFVQYLEEKSLEGLKKKAEKSGIPYGILKKVYDRGMAAWKSGHRPGASQQQWAYARVNSFITKGKGTWGKADKDLAAKVKKEEVTEQDAVKNTKDRIKREKEIDKQKHDRMLDQARLRDTRVKNKQTEEHDKCGTPDCCGQCDTAQITEAFTAGISDTMYAKDFAEHKVHGGFAYHPSVMEAGGAGDWGTDKLRKKYEQDTPMEETYDGDDFYEAYGILEYYEDELDEAEYQGHKVQLNKPMAGDVKKFKVYVKNDKGNVVKVNFGDPNMTIKKHIPARRKSFRARHNCDNPGPKTKARYWSCKKW